MLIDIDITIVQHAHAHDIDITIVPSVLQLRLLGVVVRSLLGVVVRSPTRASLCVEGAEM